jgi:DNA helicase-2/ATP-dependent DNA helicase PcrA
MWTQGLNPEQVEAVLHNEGPLLILAGAGSGKTTVLVSRTGRMISDRVALASQIAVLTFTNKAARELKHRVAVKLGDLSKGLWAGTFHSFGLSLLKKYHKAAGLSVNFGVIDQTDSQAILKELMKEIRVVGKDKFDTERLLELVNYRRTHPKAKLEAIDEYHELAESLFPKFQKKMDLLGVVDFEGLLIKPLQLLKENQDIRAKVQEQYKYLMVDEFQDTNELQMKLIDQLVGPEKNLAVVGDDDQSIYGFRGAQVSNILNFPKRYTPCKVVKLERNYRSTGKIIALANEIIENNKSRHGKVLRAESKSFGDLPELFVLNSEEDEAEFLVREIRARISQGYKFDDIAILYRSNSQAGLVEAQLKLNRIPYSVSGGSGFFDRKEVKDVLAYLRSAIAPHDVCVKRILNTPSRGIGDTTVEKLNIFAQEKKITFLKACERWKEAGVQEKTGEIILSFLDLLKQLPAKILDPSTGLTAGRNLDKVFRELGYRDYLFQMHSDPQSADKRWLLIDILGRILDTLIQKGGRDLKTLKEFLDMMDLRDDPRDDEAVEVSLMTLHACKGLEFPIVYLIGVEEDLLPHRRLGEDIDEERRLFYVGVTRAQEKLILTRAKTRKKHGVIRPSSPSRFLLEVGDENLTRYEADSRPVSVEQRQDLLKSFLSGLDSKIGPNKPRN